MKISKDKDKINELLTRGVDEVVVEDHLRKSLEHGRKLRIKFGIDPTSPHMHLGHTVPLRKLRQFQDMGHQAVLIIGDATAMIGDPTGRVEAREKLSREVVDNNQKTYLEQASKILNMDSLEVRHNGEWFHPMNAAEFLELMSLVTLQQILQRDDFRKRVDDPDHPLSSLEITYPVMQGYDSVQVKADVELGGVDQKLNLLMGRRLQRKFKMSEQDVLTVPLLEGTDGERKMSKTFENAISLEDSSEDMFAKIMSIPDSLILKYFELLTSLSLEEIGKIEREMKAGGNPRDAKARLAWEITKIYHNEKDAEAASKAFDDLFKNKQAPEDVLEIKISKKMSIVEVLIKAGFASSSSDARRVIKGGGVKVDEVVVDDHEQMIAPSKKGVLVQKGKRFFVRVK